MLSSIIFALRSSSRLFSTTTSLKSSLTTIDEDGKGVRWINLNNPKKRNVLSLEMLSSIKSRVEDASRDNNLRCLVLRGNGSVFSAGHDLVELASTDSRQKVLSLASQIMIQLRELPIPVIAQVDGHAVAAGVQLLASCDIVVASSRSTFSTPGVNFGVFCTTPGVAVGRSANVKTATFMLLTGKPLTSEEAVRGGLITLSCPQTELTRVTQGILDSICQKSRPIVALGKLAFYEQMKKDNLEDAYSLAERFMCKNLDHPDAQEGIQAFSTKRKPNWSNASIDIS